MEIPQLAGIFNSPDGLATRGHYDFAAEIAVVPIFISAIRTTVELESSLDATVATEGSIRSSVVNESELSATAARTGRGI